MKTRYDAVYFRPENHETLIAFMFKKTGLNKTFLLNC